MQRLNEDLYKAENSDKYRLFGELLTANLHAVRPGAKSVTVMNYYDGSMVDIPLDPRFPASKNAQNYYKRYGKAKTAIKEKKLQLEETGSEINYLESVYEFADKADSLESLDMIRQELTDSKAGIVNRRRLTILRTHTSLTPDSGCSQGETTMKTTG